MKVPATDASEKQKNFKDPIGVINNWDDWMEY